MSFAAKSSINTNNTENKMAEISNHLRKRRTPIQPKKIALDGFPVSAVRESEKERLNRVGELQKELRTFPGEIVGVAMILGERNTHQKK